MAEQIFLKNNSEAFIFFQRSHPDLDHIVSVTDFAVQLSFILEYCFLPQPFSDLFSFRTNSNVFHLAASCFLSSFSFCCQQRDFVLLFAIIKAFTFIQSAYSSAFGSKLVFWSNSAVQTVWSPLTAEFRLPQASPQLGNQKTR